MSSTDNDLFMLIVTLRACLHLVTSCVFPDWISILFVKIFPFTLGHINSSLDINMFFNSCAICKFSEGIYTWSFQDRIAIRSEKTHEVTWCKQPQIWMWKCPKPGITCNTGFVVSLHTKIKGWFPHWNNPNIDNIVLLNIFWETEKHFFRILR